MVIHRSAEARSIARDMPYRAGLGRASSWNNVTLACGYNGYGILLAASTGEVLAEQGVTGQVSAFLRAGALLMLTPGGPLDCSPASRGIPLCGGEVLSLSVPFQAHNGDAQDAWFPQSQRSQTSRLPLLQLAKR